MTGYQTYADALFAAADQGLGVPAPTMIVSDGAGGYSED